MVFCRFSQRDKTLPFHKCGQITPGTKLFHMDFCQISHRDKTLPFHKSGQITHGTKLSHMDFCRFSHRDKTLPFHKSVKLHLVQNSPTWIFAGFHIETKLSHLKCCSFHTRTKPFCLEFYQILHWDKTLPFHKSVKLHMVQNSPV